MAGFLVRPMRVGDVGWAISRQASLYASEYGWDASFEALLCEIGAGFLKSFDPAREAGLIAERDGAILGTAFVARGEAADAAKLRMVYVEAQARGAGVGSALVEAAMAFARSAGYARVTLWTNDVLHPARRLYERAGFRLIRSEPHRSFGVDLVGEYWERAL
jgi:GNAT superfamily N-acetyltransferase